MIAVIVIANIGSIVALEWFFSTPDNKPPYVRVIVIDVVIVAVLFVIVWFVWLRR